MEQRAYTVPELIELGQQYMAGTGTSRTKLSILAAGHNRLFERIFAGYDCRTQAAERASDWFDRNWPADVDWPKAVEPRHPLAIS